MSGSNGTLEARWDGSTPPVSKIVGIRRGQSAAEELAVPDSYFAGADCSTSLRSSQLDPGCSSTPSSRTALFVRISVTVTPSSVSSRRPSEPSEPPWVSPQGQNSACFEDVVERGLGRHSHLREAGLEQDPV